jgi:hypothetical protein
MRKNALVSWSALALGVLLAGTGGCGDVQPLAVKAIRAENGVVPSIAAGTVVSRPVNERSSGVLAPTGPCSSGVQIQAQGSGVATLLGAFDIDLTWCLDQTTGVIASGTSVVTAANGDRVHFTETGQAVSPSELAFHLVIVGGTGRFEGASGALEVTAILGEAGSWTSRGTGWMAY